MWKLMIAGTTLLAVIGQARANDPQIKEANTEVLLCQYKAAMQLDDGVSDVKSLAPIIADSCQKESNRFYEVVRSKINGPMNERQARQMARDADLQGAGTIILMKRADDRKYQQK